MNDLVVAFNEYFKVVPANTPGLLNEVFRLRYQALCIERSFPDFGASFFPDEVEKDIYDLSAVHALLQHRPSKAYVGTVRLLLPDPTDLTKPFPGQQHIQFDPKLIDMGKLCSGHTAEISRFVLLSRFPHHEGVRGRKPADRRDLKGGRPTRRRVPHAFIGLAVGVMGMCAQHNISHWFSVMDPSLNRLLGLYGMQLDPVGPLVEYHGQRRPYFVDLIKVFNRTYTNHRMVWELLTDYGRIWPAALERRLQPRPQDIGVTLKSA